MDRLLALRGQNQVTGIDFVFVAGSQTSLRVYFHDPQPGMLAVSLVNALTSAQLSIVSSDGGEALPSVAVTNVAWTTNGLRDVLVVSTAEPGDFSNYTLTIADPRIDPFYNGVRFSFKAGCDSQLDCAAAPHVCPADASDDYGIDYLARDFESFRTALFDFASTRYPAWQDRLEADAGVMFAELLSALGDEMAYFQDRVAREKALATASERRSLRKHARLLDYELDDGRAATVWIDITCRAGQSGPLPAGTAIVDQLPDVATGRQPQRWFEIGNGLDDTLNNVQFAIAALRNAFGPHIWDDSMACLPVGSVTLDIEGHHAADLPFDDFPAGGPPGKWLLLKTMPSDPAITPRAWMVRVIAITELMDPVLAVPVTRLTWETASATPFELDLTFLTVRGNLVRATAGRRYTQGFTIGASGDPTAPSAIARTGHDGTALYLNTLAGSEAAALAWLPAVLRPDQGPALRKPEVHLQERATGNPWTWRRALLGVSSAERADEVFTLEDGSWQRVVGYRRPTEEIVFRDYAATEGVTLRFGDGEFGRTPPQHTVFDVTYRLANGSLDNVGAGSLQAAILTPALATLISDVTNPLPAVDGADAESDERIRQRAPYAFQSVTYRAVRTEDYAAAAELLPWVEQAGATMRWTGSWTTVFVTPDPRGAFAVSAAQTADLEAQMDRYRQTGREVYPLAPVYANLDLKIYLCVGVGAMHLDADGVVREDVESAALAALFGTAGLRPSKGLLDHDNFPFGAPLQRSALEAALQAVPGVIAVEDIEVRRRGWHDWRSFSEYAYTVGANEMIRIYNDRNLPERGSVQLFLEVSAA
jgi:hypothetical protein